MKTYKGQIDETWTEVDLTDFLKDNPEFAPKPIEEPPDPDKGHYDYLKESGQLKSFDIK